MVHPPTPQSDDGPRSLLARRLLAISTPLALIVFFILGFAFHGWAYAWLVFLIPPMLVTWTSIQERQGYGRITEKTQPYPYEDASLSAQDSRHSITGNASDVEGHVGDGADLDHEAEAGRQAP